MKRIKRLLIVIVLSLVLIVLFRAMQIKQGTPVGAIRYACLKQGHVVSALFLKAEKADHQFHEEKMVYKITFMTPYEKPTATWLDQWNVYQRADGKYEAAYGVG